MALRDIWDDFKAGLRDTEIDPATGKEVPKKQNPYMNMIMGQSQGGAPDAGGPAVGIMGPAPNASTQFTDVSQQGLMSPRTGQGPRPMQEGMQAGMQQMPGPQQRGLAGLMGMAPQMPQQQQQEPNMQGAKMNEYLKGLLYG